MLAGIVCGCITALALKNPLLATPAMYTLGGIAAAAVLPMALLERLVDRLPIIGRR